jgi:hypothetical protein
VVSTSAGYAASRDPRVHFGLARFRTVHELEIRWPAGARQVLKNLQGNTIHKIQEMP